MRRTAIGLAVAVLPVLAGGQNPARGAEHTTDHT